MKNLLITTVMVLLTIICFSQKESKKELNQNLKIKADVVYANKYGVALTMDYIQPIKANGAAVVFINSGGFESGKIRFVDIGKNFEIKYLKNDELMIFPERFKYPPLAQFGIDELIKEGFTVFDVRHGSNPKFTIDEIVEDCRLAISFIKKNSPYFGVDSTRIGIWGGSAGGYLASYLGSQNMGIRSVVVYYPTGYDFLKIKSNFPDVFNSFACFAVDSITLYKLSLRQCLKTNTANFLIIYGKDDFPFITLDCEAMVNDLKISGAKYEVIAIPGTGHEFRGKDGYHAQHGEYARTRMVDWFKQSLQSAK